MTDFDVVVELVMFLVYTRASRVWLRADVYRRVMRVHPSGMLPSWNLGIVRVAQRNDFHA